MPNTQTFSQKLQRLEQIIAQLERPDVELEDGLKLLEEGVKLQQECQTMLAQTQTKITKLLDVNQTAELGVSADQLTPDQPTIRDDLFSQPSESEEAEPTGLPF